MAVVFLTINSLESEQQQEGHHKTEEPHSLGQGETQDGVREQLLLEGGVPGVADDEGTEHRSNTSSCNRKPELI